MDFVALVEEEFGEVATVLAGDASDESSFQLNFRSESYTLFVMGYLVIVIRHSTEQGA